jgi:N-acetylmuramoyl-L-alanine amidase
LVTGDHFKKIWLAAGRTIKIIEKKNISFLGGNDLKKLWLTFLILTVLLFGFGSQVNADLVGGVEWQFKNDQFNLNTLKADFWFADRWGIGGNYCVPDHSLSAALLYKTNPVFRTSYTYIGLGVRDLNDSYNSGLTLTQRLELTCGAEWDLSKFVPGLSVALEARTIPNELFNRDESKPGFVPVFGLSVNYQFLGARTPGTTNLGSGTISDNDLDLLAKLITAEAGDEPYEGQVAVAAVVLNRTKSGEFPTTIREVINQPGQFSSLPKLPATVPTESSFRAAKEALAGADPSRGALYFYNPATCSPEGLRFFTTSNLRITVRIGGHVFLK